MRKIKFRAYFPNKAEMKIVATQNIYEGNNTYLYLSPMPGSNYEPIKLMQYTGLKDKNGKEIYEGDIAKSGKRLFVARWNNDIASFVWEPLDGESSYPCFNVGTVKNMEIVGNVFENPELLEGEE